MIGSVPSGWTKHLLDPQPDLSPANTARALSYGIAAALPTISRPT